MMKSKASAKSSSASSSVADIRSCRHWMFRFLVVSTVLMLASTSLLHRKPDSLLAPLRRPPDPSTHPAPHAYGMRKPLPAHHSLNALAQAHPLYTASNHRRDALYSAEALAVQDLVQDMVSFREDVLLLVLTVSEAHSSLDTEFKRNATTFFCIFHSTEEEEVFHTPVTSVNRKQGTSLHFVKCLHPAHRHLVSSSSSKGVEAPGGGAAPSRSGAAVPDASAPRDSDVVAMGRVTLCIRGAGRHPECFPSLVQYAPLSSANASWEEPLVYEITMQEESVGLLAKNLKARGSNKLFDVHDLSCVFSRRPAAGVGVGTGEAVVHTTKALMGAQEVVHCEWPSPEVRPSLVGSKVSLSGARYGGLLPSVAYFHPDPHFLNVVAPEDQQGDGGVESELQAGLRLPPPPPPLNFNLCACTMVWNKAKFLKEWVMYHAHLGAQRFFIYDNNSDDDLDEVIAALNRGSSTLTHEDARMRERVLGYFTVTSHFWPWLKTQQAAFSHCAVRARKEGCEWVMFADVDEFVHPIGYMEESAAPPEATHLLPHSNTIKARARARAHRKGKKNSGQPGEGRTLLFAAADDQGTLSRHPNSSPRGRGQGEGDLEGEIQYRSGDTTQLRAGFNSPRDNSQASAVDSTSTGLIMTRRNMEDDLVEEEEQEDGDCATKKEVMVEPASVVGLAKIVSAKPLLRTLIQDVTVKQKPIYVRVNASQPPSRIGEIRFDCHNFGPSGLKHHPHRGVSVGYTCRAAAPQRHKSIVRTDAVSATLLNVLHHFELRPGFESVSILRKFGIVNHYKFQVWEDFKLKFVRRAGTYTTDWTLKQNEKSKDRTPGLATEPVMPQDWHQRFCEVRDTLLKDYVSRTFTTNSGKLLWQSSGGDSRGIQT